MLTIVNSFDDAYISPLMLRSLSLCRIHETLNRLQQDQLEKLRRWLTETEDRISQLGAGQQPDTLAVAGRMLSDHQSLQQDLRAQEEYVNDLSNMVVIVDESADCSQMEDQLSALGERWSHVCLWAEQRAAALQQLLAHWQQLDAELHRLKSWLATHEHSLRLIEANPSTDRHQMNDTARQLQVRHQGVRNSRFGCTKILSLQLILKIFIRFFRIFFSEFETFRIFSDILGLFKDFSIFRIFGDFSDLADFWEFF